MPGDGIPNDRVSAMFQALARCDFPASGLD